MSTAPSPSHFVYGNFLITAACNLAPKLARSKHGGSFKDLRHLFIDCGYVEDGFLTSYRLFASFQRLARLAEREMQV